MKLYFKNVIRRNDMLVLTRKMGQEIVINNDVTLMVLGINGSQVRLGIDAPADVPVHRKEIQDRIDAENEETL